MLATKPMMIMLMQGGMVSAITAVQASRPAVSFGSCLVLRTAGMMMPPTAAMSASLEPDTPEKKAVAVMVISPSPPRTRPNMRSSSSMRRDDMPLASISSPASTKKGIASSTKWSVPAITCCEYTSMGSDGSAMKNTSDDRRQHKGDRHAQHQAADETHGQQHPGRDGLGRAAACSSPPPPPPCAHADAQRGPDHARRAVDRVGQAEQRHEQRCR